MAPLLTVIVILGLLVLGVLRVRAGHLHFRVADWPLPKQIEAALALVFAGAAGLGTLAGEYAFASWLGLMAAIIAAFALLTWPKNE